MVAPETKCWGRQTVVLSCYVIADGIMGRYSRQATPELVPAASDIELFATHTKRHSGHGLTMGYFLRA